MPKSETTAISSRHDNVLTRLKTAQSRFGYVPEESILEIAQALNVPISEVYGVATFYSFLSTRPLGENVIWVCRSLPCHLKHSDMIIEAVTEETGIKPGETTADGRFSLRLTNCIGACDLAPAMLVNHDLHGNLTPARISEILKSYK